MVVHKILPTKKLFVDDVLKETKSTFKAFKFVIYLDGQTLTLYHEKNSSSLLINHKPFFSFQDLLDEQTHERTGAYPITSLDQIEIAGLHKQASQFACNLSNQKTLETNLQIYDKEKPDNTRNVVSEMALKETPKMKTEFEEIKKTKADNSRNIINQALIVIKEEDNLKQNNETKKKKKTDDKGVQIKEQILKKEENNSDECSHNKEFDENEGKDSGKFKFNEEIEEEILKLDKVFNSDSNQDRIVKDMDLTRRNLAKINVFKV